MARTLSLPLILGLLICISKEWPEDVPFEELEPDIQVVGNNMWVALNPVLDELAPDTVIACSHGHKSREVSM